MQDVWPQAKDQAETEAVSEVSDSDAYDDLQYIISERLAAYKAQTMQTMAKE